ncbi:Glucose-6-phosphate 1-dehydrogenase [Hibiscus syriacus]|uniref:glucose-6-phosphate dehydrogenase (NADP(+)) n=1 Tax=Hibiscus syriacus TaxID=106335 RepID=A0A6A3A1A4_HIBSY|nr:Glucose-6-phosphate 1-dehydrogenase [Hibiscus syriacus]
MGSGEWFLQKRDSFRNDSFSGTENVPEIGCLSIIVLGASGDLAKKTFPAPGISTAGRGACFRLCKAGYLVTERSSLPSEDVSKFLQLIKYVSGTYAAAEGFQLLDKEIMKHEISKSCQKGSSRILFYLALPPSVYPSVCRMIRKYCMNKCRIIGVFKNGCYNNTTRRELQPLVCQTVVEAIPLNRLASLEGLAAALVKSIYGRHQGRSSGGTMENKVLQPLTPSLRGVLRLAYFRAMNWLCIEIQGLFRYLFRCRLVREWDEIIIIKEFRREFLGVIGRRGERVEIFICLAVAFFVYRGDMCGERNDIHGELGSDILCRGMKCAAA